LISHEDIDGFKMTKFPGGGLEFGEDVKTCLLRELEEELHFLPEKLKLFHVTESFIKSAFAEKEQVIAVYYLINENINVTNETISQETKVGKQNILWFDWQPLNAELNNVLTFEMDKEVLQKLMMLV
jgi:ADP-ribose pyrophosphatase YjhB (NUDIX family)